MVERSSHYLPALREAADAFEAITGISVAVRLGHHKESNTTPRTSSGEALALDVSGPTEYTEANPDEAHQVMPLRIGGTVPLELLVDESRSRDAAYSNLLIAVLRIFVRAIGRIMTENFTVTADLQGEIQRLHQSQAVANHEIQNRVQGIIADAENTFAEMPELSTSEAQAKLLQLVRKAEVLSTVAYTLGDWRLLQEYKFERHHIRSLVVQAVELYEAEASSRRIAIRYDLEPPNQTLILSPLHFQHALNNLVHNAVKYSYHGGVQGWRTVQIKGRIEGDKYVLTISNFGVGMLKHEISTGVLFEEGYQGELTRGEFRSGAGRGLAFARAVIMRHGGDIKIESTPVIRKRGSPNDAGENAAQPYFNRFSIYLPLPWVGGIEEHDEEG